MNCVRKHLFGDQGRPAGAGLRAGAGREPAGERHLQRCSPATGGSGPTVPRSDHLRGALAVLARYGGDSGFRRRIRARLEERRARDAQAGRRGLHGNAVHIIATPQRITEAAAAAARAAGIEAHVRRRIEGESREVGKLHAALARRIAARPAVQPGPAWCSRAARSPPVAVHPAVSGRGGRGTEFLLGCAIALHGEPNVHVLAADTDGIDGSEENTGAFVSPSAWPAPRPSACRRADPDGDGRLRLLCGARRPRRSGEAFADVDDCRGIPGALIGAGAMVMPSAAMAGCRASSAGARLKNGGIEAEGPVSGRGPVAA